MGLCKLNIGRSDKRENSYEYELSSIRVGFHGPHGKTLTHPRAGSGPRVRLAPGGDHGGSQVEAASQSRTRSGRPLAPVFSRMCARWNSTVRWLTPSFWAASL